MCLTQYNNEEKWLEQQKYVFWHMILIPAHVSFNITADWKCLTLQWSVAYHLFAMQNYHKHNNLKKDIFSSSAVHKTDFCPSSKMTIMKKKKKNILIYDLQQILPNKGLNGSLPLAASHTSLTEAWNKYLLSYKLFSRSGISASR